MKKLVFAVALTFLLVFFTNQVKASIVVVDLEGRLIINVLSSEDTLALIPKSDYLEVKEVSGGGVLEKGEIQLSNSQGKVTLNILTDNGEKDLNVTNINDNLVEIETKDEAKNLKIKAEGDKFLLEQSGLIASTLYPIKINSKEKHIYVLTPTGERYLSFLPLDAAQSALRARIISKLNYENMEISESEGKLTYNIKGEKIINIFNIVNYSYPVNVNISAQTGEVVSDTTPIWLKILGFVIG